MATKTITITEDAYDVLKSRKLPDESFSEVIKRVVGEKRDIMRHAGAWKHIPDEEIEEMKNNIKELRRKSTEAALKRVKNDMC